MATLIRENSDKEEFRYGNSEKGQLRKRKTQKKVNSDKEELRQRRTQKRENPKKREFRKGRV